MVSKEEMIEMLKKAEIHLTQSTKGTQISIEGSEIALKAGVLSIIESLSKLSGESMRDILIGFMAAVEVRDAFNKGDTLTKDKSLQQLDDILDLFKSALEKNNDGGLKN